MAHCNFLSPVEKTWVTVKKNCRSRQPWNFFLISDLASPCCSFRPLLFVLAPMNPENSHHPEYFSVYHKTKQNKPQNFASFQSLLCLLNWRSLNTPPPPVVPSVAYFLGSYLFNAFCYFTKSQVSTKSFWIGKFIHSLVYIFLIISCFHTLRSIEKRA